MKTTIRTDSFLDPEPLVTLTELNELSQPLKDYRCTFRAHQAAWSERERGTARFKEAQDKTEQLIAQACEQGRSGDQIWRQVGEVSVMPNTFAVSVSDAYLKLAKQQQTVLVKLIRKNADKIFDYLKAQQQKGNAELEREAAVAEALVKATIAK